MERLAVLLDQALRLTLSALKWLALPISLLLLLQWSLRDFFKSIRERPTTSGNGYLPSMWRAR